MSLVLQWHFKWHLKLHWQGGGKSAEAGKRLGQLLFSAPGEMQLHGAHESGQTAKVKIQPLVSREVWLIQLMIHLELFVRLLF